MTMAVLLIVCLLFTNCILLIHASYHWVVTENGKIQSQLTNSGFPVRRPDDLMSLLEQEQRINKITKMYQELVSFKRSIDNQWTKIEGEEDFEKRLYESDEDCILASKPLTKHDLTTEFVDYGLGSRPKMKTDISPMKVPDCTTYSKLDFSMMTFPHLETLNRRDNLTVNPVPSRKPVDFDIDSMLKINHTDWTAYNVASLYWRNMGNGTNALECARRAIYFSPRDKRHIVLLNLGTLLQELESLGEAAIVLHSAVDHDPLQHMSHLALGNVYAILGDYTRSLACYENVLSLYPSHEKARQLKHAVFCQEKLESGLLEIHSLLQNILQDLQKYHEMKEKWQLLQNQVNWEKDSKHLYSFSQPMYLNLRFLLSNVEKQAKSLMNDVSKSVRQKKNYSPLESIDTNLRPCCKGEHCSMRYRNKDVDWAQKKARFDNANENTKDSVDVPLDVCDDSEYFLLNKMNSLTEFIKSISYDSNVDLVDFKRKIHQQIGFLKTLNEDSHFSPDQATFLNNFDGCLNSHNEFKTLNDCFMRMLDKYSFNVRIRIAKLKEQMKLIKQNEVKGNQAPDESSLENYIEVSPELTFEAEPCQRFRDKTEL